MCFQSVHIEPKKTQFFPQQSRAAFGASMKLRRTASRYELKVTTKTKNVM